MSDCCATERNTVSRKLECPANGHACIAVSLRTVLHHVKRPWELTDRERNYYFCDDPACDVVYFSAEGDMIGHEAVRTPIGIKKHEADAPLCYCFGITFADAQADPGCESFVKDMTRQGACSCATHNPSGRCCLKDFPPAPGT